MHEWYLHRMKLQRRRNSCQIQMSWPASLRIPQSPGSIYRRIAGRPFYTGWSGETVWTSIRKRKAGHRTALLSRLSILILKSKNRWILLIYLCLIGVFLIVDERRWMREDWRGTIGTWTETKTKEYFGGLDQICCIFPIIALLAFWALLIRLWVLGDFRIPLVFIGLWLVGLISLSLLGRGYYFMGFEAVLALVLLVINGYKGFL